MRPALLLLSLGLLDPSTAQTAFSPFSLLGSFLQSVPGWPLRNTKTVKPRSALHKLPKKFFRPHLALGPAISPSQNIPTLVRHSPEPALSPSDSAPTTLRILHSAPHLLPGQPDPATLQLVELARHPTKQSKQANLLGGAGQRETGSGPNPGDFPIISLLDRDHLPDKYYTEVLRTIQPAPAPPPNTNPYYAPEEFTYNQDPITISHSQDEQQRDAGFEQVEEEEEKEKEEGESSTPRLTIVTPVPAQQLHQQTVRQQAEQASLQPTTQTEVLQTATPAASIFSELEQPDRRSKLFGRSLNPKDIFRKKVRAKEKSNLVKTIEYKPSDIKLKRRQRVKPAPVQSLSNLINCNASEETGFCALTPSYPTKIVEDLIENCREVTEAFQAVIPDDADSLGDNSVNVISSEKDLTRPWSWKVYAYKKRQVCDSELSFVRPSYAQSTTGEWSAIIQTARIVQRVGLDVCLEPGQPCPGLNCVQPGRSVCIQRYQHQLLLSLPGNTTAPACPAIRAFTLPAGCVCHAETSDTLEPAGAAVK